MKAVQVFAITLTLLVSRTVSRAFPFPQHPVCIYKENGTSYALTCGDSYNLLTIPDDFDVSVIHPNTSSFTLKHDLIRRDFTPLPELPLLTYVKLDRDRVINGAYRLDFNGFLANNKRHLKELFMQRIPLNQLTAADFRGFHSLEKVTLHECDVKSIAADTFGELGFGRSGFLEFQPKLSFVSLSGNRFEEFPWDVLEPLQSSIKVLRLSSNGLKRITANKNFTAPSLQTLSLTWNYLSTIPSSVLRNFEDGANTNKTVDLLATQFCRGSKTCNCCDVSPIFEFGVRNPNVIQQFVCGKEFFFKFAPSAVLTNC